MATCSQLCSTLRLSFSTPLSMISPFGVLLRSVQCGLGIEKSFESVQGKRFFVVSETFRLAERHFASYSIRTASSFLDDEADGA